MKASDSYYDYLKDDQLRSKIKSLNFHREENDKLVDKNQFSGSTLGVFTSGGDAQGMNAAVRAIVRMGIYLGCQVYLIHEGYKGMVEGGNENIKLANWSIVSGVIGIGGTIIGSARCSEFRERSGRLKAAKNLIAFGINNLVCIGGDGTLTGANLFKNEWPHLLEELFNKNEISIKQKESFPYLNIVGIVGSIDNDFCGTDMTIGANTAVHRIIEAIDAISTTAQSHQRCFVMEVMGRNCGYLALSAGLACEADWVMIPENPPDLGWEETMCKHLSYHREAGHRLNIILVAEGATDKNGNPITVHYVKNVITTRLKIDTKVTILGHVQRGGFATAYDRILGCRMGSEAVLTLMMAKPEDPAYVIGVNGNRTCYIPLIESVRKIQMVYEALREKDFKRAVELRGEGFQRNLETYIKMSKLEPKLIPAEKKYCFGILNLGAPACGVNSCVRSFVRHGVSRSCKILGIHDGFEGLISDSVEELDWKSVYGWTSKGGSLLGCNRIDAKKIGFDKIAEKIRKYKIDGLVLIGGFDAYNSVIQLSSQRYLFEEFCIPLICIPATISNNIPGSDFSIGCDTSLNEIVTICDKIKQSAMGSKRRVFLIEVMGGYSGYLASLAGLASGADHSFIFEEPFTINDIIDDIRHLKNKMKGDLKSGILIRNEMANKNYTSEFIQNLMTEEGAGVFSARLNVLGHLQQGGVPTSFDRNLGIKLGAKALNYMLEILEKIQNQDEYLNYANSRDKTAVLIGLAKIQLTVTPINDLIEETDFQHRIPLKKWWMKLRPLNRILGKHEAVYTSEALTKFIA